MAEANGWTVAELVELFRERHARLPFEIGAYVALQVCEEVQLSPRLVSPEVVRLHDDGTVALISNAPVAPDEAARQVVALLTHLLLAAGAAVPPGMLRLVESGPSGGVWNLPQLRDELEACLVPLNRGAATRVLSRLLREAKRPKSRRPGNELATLSEEAVDADLDAFLAGGEAPPSVSVQVPAAAPPPAPAPAPAPAEPPPGIRDFEGLDDAPKRRLSPWVWPAAALALLVIFVGGVAAMRPELIDQLLGQSLSLGDPGASPSELREAAEAARRAEQAERYGDLVVHVMPERAQVLLRVGDGPAVAENLPLGVAHEFIAIAEGREPTRAIVPVDAAWLEVEGGVRYELAMQTGEDAMDFADLDLGATRLPRDVGSPSGRLGSVRVLTNPPGAAVYQLIGFSPDVRVRDIAVDVEHELVVFHQGYAPQRLTLSPDDCDVVEGRKVCEVEVTLERRRRRRGR